MNKFISVALVMSLLLTIFQLNVFAKKNDANLTKPQSQEQDLVPSDTKSTEKNSNSEAKIISEITEKREKM